MEQLLAPTLQTDLHGFCPAGIVAQLVPPIPLLHALQPLEAGQVAGHVQQLHGPLAGTQDLQAAALELSNAPCNLNSTERNSLCLRSCTWSSIVYCLCRRGEGPKHTTAATMHMVIYIMRALFVKVQLGGAAGLDKPMYQGSHSVGRQSFLQHHSAFRV